MTKCEGAKTAPNCGVVKFYAIVRFGYPWHAKAHLEATNRLAQRGLRYAQLRCSPVKAALPRDRQESRSIV